MRLKKLKLTDSRALFSFKNAIIEEKLKDLAVNGVSRSDILEYIKNSSKVPIIPLAIFAVRELAAMQSLVLYLKETLGYSNHQIALLLGRSDKTIWHTFAQATKKYSHAQQYAQTKYDVPLSAFRATSHTVFEQLVLYLHENQQLSYRIIGGLLHRNERTIWTVHHRAKQKRGDES